MYYISCNHWQRSSNVFVSTKAWQQYSPAAHARRRAAKQCGHQAHGAGGSFCIILINMIVSKNNNKNYRAVAKPILHRVAGRRPGLALEFDKDDRPHQPLALCALLCLLQTLPRSRHLVWPA